MLNFHAQSSELRVFISSTFQDLSAERDHLVKHIFPEIRQICRTRGVEFTEIDLRWGVTEEEASMGRVIRTCLEEIDRCRPYFIGILGSRYGWVPRLHEVQKDYELLQRYPWIEDAAVDELSIVEMEYFYGFLNDPISADGAFVYYREFQVGAGRPTDDDARRLARLRSLAAASGRPLRSFRDPIDLGGQVREDLLAIIERDWPVTGLPSPLQTERAGHAAYAAQRRRAYIARIDSLRRLNRHAADAGSPLVVVGESGIGKSALLAYWVSTYRRRNPDVFIFEHYVEASGAAESAAIVERLIAELRERFYPTGTPLIASEEIDQELPHLLAGVTTPMVIVIDALDRLDERSRGLAWLPAYLPPAVRIIVSTSSADADVASPLRILRDRGWNELSVKPLDREEREALTVRFLGEYRKGLASVQLRRIADDVRCSVPIFLRTLLEELRLCGSFETLDAQIEHYLAAEDSEGLFRLLLERLERDYTEPVVREVLVSIWASRGGLSETDLLELTGIGRTALSTFLIALDYHLSQRSGLISCAHEYLRRAIVLRYVSDDESRRTAHARLAEYFERQPRSERVVEELPWQLQRADRWEALRECLANIPVFRFLRSSGREYELLGYWLAIDNRFDMVETYHESLCCYGLDHDDVELADAGNAVGEFLYQSGRIAAAEGLFRRSLALRQAHLPSVDPEIAQSMANLGAALLHRHEYDEAESLFAQAHAINLESLGEDHPETVDNLIHRAFGFRNRGLPDIAEELCRRALALNLAARGREHSRTLATFDLLASILAVKGDYEKAEEILRDVVDIRERALGPNNLETAHGLEELARILMRTGKADEAERCLRRAYDVHKNLIGADHPETIALLINLGVTIRDHGALDEAEELLRRAVERSERALGTEHQHTAAALNSLGQLMHKRCRYSEAEALYRRGLAIEEVAVGAIQSNAATIRLNLGRVLFENGRAVEAELMARAVVEIHDRLEAEGRAGQRDREASVAARKLLAAIADPARTSRGGETV